MAQPPPRPSAPRPAGGAQPASSSGPRVKDSDHPAGTFFLGRYRVVDEIGVGGMASVHLARMDGPGGFQKWVAIKRIHPHLVEDDQFVDMFLDEARIAAGINHANVAQVFDLGKDDNTYWIAMEYLHGEPLREVMRRAEDRRAIIQPELAARICSDAAEGLHAAHELRGKNGQLLGLVHRDVTPHNLFITYDGYTKVVDFGIAKVADRLSSTRAGTLKGKLAYMSPEQVRGAEVDRTTDLFALGVVLWELTTGHRLFRMDTDLDTLEKVQACVVPPPSTLVADYPVELESVVMKALSKRKQERYSTAREFSRALQSFFMRRGPFVGPEEVSQFVRDVFADRIKKREAHLAWAAEVTSTINVDQLRAGQVSLTDTGEDLSGMSFDTEDKPTGATAGNGPPPPLSIPMQSGRGVGRPPTAPRSVPPPPPSAGVPPRGGGMKANSLMDDDEDVPTTVATREHIEARSKRPQAAATPRPAAGIPSSTVALPPPRPAAGMPAPPHAPAHAPAPASGPHAAGPHAAGPHAAGPHAAGPHAAGPHAAGPHAAGPHAAGPYAAGPYSPRPHSQHGPTDGERTAALPGGAAALLQGQNLQGPRSPPGMGMPTSADAPKFGPPPSAGPPSGGGPAFGTYAPAFNGAAPSFGAPPSGHGSVPDLSQAAMAAAGAVGGAQGAVALGADGAVVAVPGMPQSQVETALSLPRPDPAALWLAQQEAAKGHVGGRNTGVLIAIGLLTALCVIGVGALIYFKYQPAETTPALPTEKVATPLPTADVAGGKDGAGVATPTPSVATGDEAAAEDADAPSGGDEPGGQDATGDPPTGAANVNDGSGTKPPDSDSDIEPGLLTIVCSPVCDEVLDGGKSLGPSPIVQVPASPGSHRITLKRAGEKTKVVSVVIVSGEVTAQRVVMK